MDSTDPVVQLFKQYTATIKTRDEARRLAESHEKKRKEAWREFYKLTEELDLLEKNLGIDECPPAPKKMKREPIKLEPIKEE